MINMTFRSLEYDRPDTYFRLTYPIPCVRISNVKKVFFYFLIWICTFLGKKNMTLISSRFAGDWGKNRSLHGSHIQMNKSYPNEFSYPLAVEAELYGTCMRCSRLEVEQGCCLEWLPSSSAVSHLQYEYQGWHPLWVSPSHWALGMNTKIHLPNEQPWTSEARFLGGRTLRTCRRQNASHDSQQWKHCTRDPGQSACQWHSLSAGSGWPSLLPGCNKGTKRSKPQQFLLWTTETKSNNGK